MITLLMCWTIVATDSAFAQVGADEDLGEELIREATGEDATGIMGEIMSLMEGSAERLGRDFDPGGKTQQLQQAIVDSLDAAIKSAMRRKSKGGQQQPQSSSDERSAPDESQEQDEASKQQQGAVVEPSTTSPQRGAPSPAGPLGELRELRRGWGNLPARDRDEVLQGIDEEFLEKYRPLIEEYFRALAEDDDSQ